ncbi:putative enzyme related to lactoylglutathione lyase [Mycobacterium sp. OAS707]|uniref:VOC family protein n=1 Tax=unclassified Mycobacterium TaxID=2642494 RepID=UPI00178BAE9F|nr:VOC family protein [Mycobacterium sp. OAS707]MBE1548551.1 putative enzyme related to lactoylglutathione lyase [Mycobacterium sp. OAS707]
MAHVDYVLAVVAVSDIEVGKSWYTKLFGREPDNNPMPNLIEWQVTNGGWVQVTEDPQRAGNGMLNLAVSDIDDGARELRELGINAAEIITANKGVRLCPVTDPDNNKIQLVGNFRVKY